MVKTLEYLKKTNFPLFNEKAEVIFNSVSWAKIALSQHVYKESPLWDPRASGYKVILKESHIWILAGGGQRLMAAKKQGKASLFI